MKANSAQWFRFCLSSFQASVSGVEHVLIRENFCRSCVREAMSNWGSASGRRTKADVLRTRAEFFVVRFGGSDFVLQIVPQRGVRRHELRHLLLQRVLWRIVFGRRERPRDDRDAGNFATPRAQHHIKVISNIEVRFEESGFCRSGFGVLFCFGLLL